MIRRASVILLVLAAASGVTTLASCGDPRPVRPIDDEDAAADASTGDEAEDAAPPPPPPVELGRHDVKVVDTRRVVPSPGLPPEANALVSNNNLDVVRFDGKVFLVWRTAPDHFASTKTVMHVVSSTDETTWTHEKTYAVGADLREPRFLVLGGTLFVYFARLGSDPVKFQPQGVSFAKRNGDGTWTELADAMRATPDGDGGSVTAPMTGFIAWRTRTERDKPYMTAYLGGEHIYDFDGKPLEIDLLTTTDGVAWQGVDPKKPAISRGGGSETDFAIGDDGTLFGVIRNEAGDETGFGSKVCRAASGDLATWSCKHDPKKYDSPLMFFYDGEAYLVGRRNVTETGNFDLGKPAENLPQTALKYGIDYRSHPKRCSLWRYVQGEDRIAYILDLPSKGDTCFPARIAGSSPEEIVLYNYSSDIDGADISWAEGQVSPTFIYRHVLRFTRR